LVYGYNLKNGNTQSCGCYKIDRTKEANSTHGRSRTAIYHIYYGLLDRCFNPENKRYSHYGARGITVDSSWLGEAGFERFCEDMGPRPSRKHSIERRDNNGAYGPNNCRWATQKEQSRNKRSNRLVSYKGETKPLSQFCEELGLPYRTIWWRINAGWSAKQAFEGL